MENIGRKGCTLMFKIHFFLILILIRASPTLTMQKPQPLFRTDSQAKIGLREEMRQLILKELGINSQKGQPDEQEYVDGNGTIRKLVQQDNSATYWYITPNTDIYHPANSLPGYFIRRALDEDCSLEITPGYWEVVINKNRRFEFHRLEEFSV